MYNYLVTVSYELNPGPVPVPEGYKFLAWITFRHQTRSNPTEQELKKIALIMGAKPEGLTLRACSVLPASFWKEPELELASEIESGE